MSSRTDSMPSVAGTPSLPRAPPRLFTTFNPPPLSPPSKQLKFPRAKFCSPFRARWQLVTLLIPLAAAIVAAIAAAGATPTRDSDSAKDCRADCAAFKIASLTRRRQLSLTHESPLFTAQSLHQKHNCSCSCLRPPRRQPPHPRADAPAARLAISGPLVMMSWAGGPLEGVGAVQCSAVESKNIRIAVPLGLDVSYGLRMASHHQHLVFGSKNFADQL